MRLGVSAAAGVMTAMVLGRYSWAVRGVAAWNAFGFIFLSLVWWIICTSDSTETRRRAGAEDPGRKSVGAIVVLSSFVSVFASTILLRKARTLAPHASGALIVLCLAAVACAWFLTHSTYTLRYARLFYQSDREAEGGLQFPGEGPPDDWDFAYFSFTIGMCFQVSDVAITSRSIRRTALTHQLISFVYNTAILALALNLIFGMFG